MVHPIKSNKCSDIFVSSSMILTTRCSQCLSNPNSINEFKNQLSLLKLPYATGHITRFNGLPCRTHLEKDESCKLKLYIECLRMLSYHDYIFKQALIKHTTTYLSMDLQALINWSINYVDNWKFRYIIFKTVGSVSSKSRRASNTNKYRARCSISLEL